MAPSAAPITSPSVSTSISGHKPHSSLVSISSEDFSQLVPRMDKMQLALNSIVSEKSEAIGRKLSIEDVDETAAVNWSKITHLTDLVLTVPNIKLEKRLNRSVVICSPCNLIVISVIGVLSQRRCKRNDSFAYGLNLPLNSDDSFYDGRG